MARRYELKKRAERRDQTRLRIVEATVQLHGSVGPAATQITDIAKLAGVERATVYRHFPDIASLLHGCQEHFRATYPGPDLTAWRDIQDPRARLRRALLETYRYFGEHREMVANVLRDAEWMSAVAFPPGFVEMKRVMVETLLPGWGTRGRVGTRVRAAIGVAVDFHTWDSLAGPGGELGMDEAVELMVRLVETAAS